MSDVPSGMYLKEEGENPTEKIPKYDPKYENIRTASGAIKQVPSVGYVKYLEGQIVNCQKSIADGQERERRQGQKIARLAAALKKMEARIR